MIREYRRDLQYCYLVMYSEDEQVEMGYEVRMITENEIPGLLSCSCKRIDDKVLYYYNVTSKITLKERLYSKKITGEEIITLLRSLLSALTNIDEYLLPGDAICLDMDCIFVDAQMEKIEFCYLSQRNGDFEKNLQNMMEELLPFLDHQNAESAQIGYDIFHYLMRTPFTLDGLREELNDLQKRDMDSICEKQEKTNIYIEEKEPEKIDIQDILEEHEKYGQKKSALLIMVGISLLFVYGAVGWYLWKNFKIYMMIWGIAGTVLLCSLISIGFIYKKLTNRKSQKCEKDNLEISENIQEELQQESIVLDSISKQQDVQTSILCENETRFYYIMEEKNSNPYKKYDIKDCEIQIIGRFSEMADIVLEASSISRMHARIRKDGSRYYLSDLNSRNGTWVNGKEIIGTQEIELHVGDEIRFAEKLYSFKKI